MERESKWTPERDVLARSLYEQGLSLMETGRRVGSSGTGRVAKAILRAGGTIRHPGEWTAERRVQARALYEGGKTLPEIAAILLSNTARVADAIRVAGGMVRPPGPAKGDKRHWQKGGRTVDKNGYVLLRVPAHPQANESGYVREHRLVMEQVLGRYLLPTETVHHRNADHADNRPENLELFASNGSHLAHELKGRCPKWTPEGRERILAAVHSRPSHSTEEQRAKWKAAYWKRKAAQQGTQPSPTHPVPGTGEQE